LFVVAAAAAGSALTPVTTARAVPSAATAPRCHTSTLAGRFGIIQGAAGSRFGPVILINHSHHTCIVRGYIGAQLIGAGGRALHTVVVRDHSRVAHPVSLRPQHSAAAEVRWSAIPRPGETCPLPRSADVTPPDETTRLHVHWTSDRVCGAGRIDVRPLVAH
jgi:hypothetical protein